MARHLDRGVAGLCIIAFSRRPASGSIVVARADCPGSSDLLGATGGDRIDSRRAHRWHIAGHERGQVIQS
jgi:hypothetical protein